jgi:chemotaxis-related protein WspB
MRVHVLHLNVGEERYALPSASVVEVVPAVALRAVPGTPPAVAGLLAYRGRVVPVVDLSRLFGRGAAPSRLSTRIAVCDLDGALRPIGERSSDAAVRRRLVGVLAECVTRVGDLDPDAPGSHPGALADGLPALGRVTADEDGLVQLVEVGQLLPADLLQRLERAAAPEPVP